MYSCFPGITACGIMVLWHDYRVSMFVVNVGCNTLKRHKIKPLWFLIADDVVKSSLINRQDTSECQFRQTVQKFHCAVEFNGENEP